MNILRQKKDDTTNIRAIKMKKRQIKYLLGTTRKRKILNKN